MMVPMESYTWKVRIHSGTLLDEWMREYLNCTDICHREDGSTIISGVLPDLPAVYGLILGLRDTGVSLISIHIDREVKTEGEEDA